MKQDYENGFSFASFLIAENQSQAFLQNLAENKKEVLKNYLKILT